MRLRLMDQGEGWFWECDSIEVEVLDEVRKHSRQFYRVLFAAPIDVREDGEPVTCGGAWLSPRWVGHEIGPDNEITALLWMVREIRQAVKPPRDVQYSARVSCRLIPPRRSAPEPRV